jgi:hypothetical protein
MFPFKVVIYNVMTSIVELIHLKNSVVVFSCCRCVHDDEYDLKKT